MFIRFCKQAELNEVLRNLFVFRMKQNQFCQHFNLMFNDLRLICLQIQAYTHTYAVTPSILLTSTQSLKLYIYRPKIYGQ